MTRREDDLEREIRQHLELEAEEQIAQGIAPDAAQRAARLAFGNARVVREDAHSVWHPLWLQQVGQDLRYGLRVMRRMPAFAVGAVLVLALGIGASTTVFATLHAVVLAPMPFEKADRLVRLYQHSQQRGVDRFSVSLPLLRDWRARTRSFTGIVAERTGVVNVLGLGDPLRLDAVFTTWDAAALFGRVPIAGRSLTAADDAIGSSPVVMLSAGLWQRAFSSRDVAGLALTIDGVRHQVVGVMPDDPLRPGDHVLLPLVPRTEDRRGHSDLEVFARLAPGVTVAQATDEMAAVSEQLERDHPDFHRGWGVRVVPLTEALLGNRSAALYTVLASVGLLLLIACANLSSLLLVKASARRREMSIRAAVGGGRARIARQLLTESVLLTALGGALGVALSWSGVRAVRALLPADLPRASELAVGWPVLLFAIAASLLTAVLVGLAPARYLSRLDILRGLREHSHAVAAATPAVSNSLVVGQVALAIVLLAGAGLTIRALQQLQNTHLGFASDRVLTVRVAPRERAEVFIDDLLTRVRRMPAVVHAGAVSSAPMSAGNLSLHVFPVGNSRLAPKESVQADWRIVSQGYFTALGTPVLAGRDFEGRDDGDAPKVIIINETLARRVWGDENPIGRRLDLGGGGGEPPTVVGLVADMRHHSPGKAAAPTYYVSAARGVWGAMTLVVRTSATADADVLIPSIRSAVAQLDPTLPVFDVQPLDALVRSRLAPQRLTSYVLGAFGALAFIIVIVGVYGVMAFIAKQRSRDAAIRMALGASARQVFRPMLTQGARLVGLGVLVGLAATVMLARALSTQFSEAFTVNPAVIAGAAVILATTALTACYVPARRLAKTDPLDTFRAM